MAADPWQRVRDLPLRSYRPRPRVVLPEHVPQRACVPVVDAHNHLGRWLSPDWMTPDLPALLTLLDDCGVEHVVNLDGLWGEQLEANLARYDRAHPRRFTTFCHVEWPRLGQGDAGESVPALIAQLEDSARRGARGVKVWKDLGLHVRDERGELVLPDDERVAAVLRRAGELGLVVLIHTADPVAFFDPLDETNERLDELAGMPEWWFGDDERYPRFETLMGSLDRLLAQIPRTTVIGSTSAATPRTWRRCPRCCTATRTSTSIWAAASPRSAASRGLSPTWWPSTRPGCCSAPTPSRRPSRPTAPPTGSSRPPTSTSPTPPRTTSRRRAAGRSVVPACPQTCCVPSTETTPPASSPSSPSVIM